MAPRPDERPSTCTQTSVKSVATHKASPSRVTRGGYRVHPEHTGRVNSTWASKAVKTATASNQYDTPLILGITISLEPHSKGSS